MKTAKIFKNGQSQAVRLPKEFRFNDSEVFIKKSKIPFMASSSEMPGTWQAGR